MRIINTAYLGQGTIRFSATVMQHDLRYTNSMVQKATSVQ